MTTGTPAIGGRLAKAAATAILLLPASAAAELDCARWLERAFWQEAVAEDVIRCLDAGADVEARADDGRPPLHWAAREGRAGAIGALVGAGADFGARDENGRTPLHWAVVQGHPDAIHGLAFVGADAGAKDNIDRSPLHWAAREGHAGAVRALADTGADVEAKDGAPPLHLAAWQGHPSAIRALLDAGANAGARTASGNLPADVAAEAVRTHPVFRELEAACRN